MRLSFARPRRRATRRRAPDDDEARLWEERRLDRAASEAYAVWRECSAALAAAYLRWKHAGAAQRAMAFGRYRAALDREQRAAHRYAAVRRHCAARRT